MLNESFPPARRIQTNALYSLGGAIPITGLGAAREFIIPNEVNEERNVVDPTAAHAAEPRNFLLVMPILVVGFLS